MPIHKTEVLEYECGKCHYKWINRRNGINGEKPARCAKCKRWDWEEGYLSIIEKRLRYQLLKIERTVCTEIYTAFGARNDCTVTDLCIEFFSMYPRPTLEELELVIDPMCYTNHDRHYYECDRNFCYCIGWVGSKCDRGLNKNWLEVESKTRHRLMRHMIDSRGGKINTNSTHRDYLLMLKSVTEDMSNKEKVDRINQLAYEAVVKMN